MAVRECARDRRDDPQTMVAIICTMKLSDTAMGAYPVAI